MPIKIPWKIGLTGLAIVWFIIALGKIYMGIPWHTFWWFWVVSSAAIAWLVTFAYMEFIR